MKTIFTLFIFMIATSAFARFQFNCQEIGNRTASRTMDLTQVSNGRLSEGVRHTFKLELRENRTRQLLLSELVTVEVEDVMFSFSNRARGINGMIYLDEMDQTWLELGRTKIRFACAM